jgi:hypothetical protein
MPSENPIGGVGFIRYSCSWRDSVFQPVVGGFMLPIVAVPLLRCDRGSPGIVTAASPARHPEVGEPSRWLPLSAVTGLTIDGRGRLLSGSSFVGGGFDVRGP